MKQQFVVIGVNNPEHYPGKQRSFLKKKSMRYNYNIYGSPITITVNTLKCKADELVRIFEEKLEEHAVSIHG